MPRRLPELLKLVQKYKFALSIDSEFFIEELFLIRLLRHFRISYDSIE
jgi:hypothetical protein